METRAKRTRQDTSPPPVDVASALPPVDEPDIMRISLATGEIFEVRKASLGRHPNSLLRLMRDSEMPCSVDERGAIRLTLPGNTCAMAFATALDEYEHPSEAAAPLRGPINPVQLHALYDFLMLPAHLLSMERCRPNSAIDVIAGQAALFRGLALAQELESFVRGITCPRLMTDAAIAHMPSLPDGGAEGGAAKDTAAMALLFYVENQLCGIDQLRPTRGDVSAMTEHGFIRRNCFSKELFELLSCPARLQWIVRTFLPQRVDELRLLRARACTEADLALQPFVLRPALLTGNDEPSLTRWSNNHSALKVVRDVGVFAVRVPIIECVGMVPSDDATRHHRHRRSRLRSLDIPTGPISGVDVYVFVPDDVDEQPPDARYRDGEFTVHLKARARGPKTAHRPVLGVDCLPLERYVEHDDEESDALQVRALNAFFPCIHERHPNTGGISRLLTVEDAERKLRGDCEAGDYEAGGALAMAGSLHFAYGSPRPTCADASVVASPDGCCWTAKVGNAHCDVDTDSEAFRTLLRADEALFPRGIEGRMRGPTKEALESEVLHRRAFKTVLIRLSELEPDAHPTVEAYHKSLDKMRRSPGGANPAHFLVVEVGSGVS